MKQLICARTESWSGGGSNCPLYVKSFTIPLLDCQKVGLHYCFNGEDISTTVKLRTFTELLPSASSSQLKDNQSVLTYFEREIKRAKETIEQGTALTSNYAKYHIVKAKYNLDAYSTGKKLLEQHLTKTLNS